MKINLLLKFSLLFSLLINISHLAHANEMTTSSANGIVITEGYVKETIPGSSVTAAYMKIRNTNNSELSLQKVTSPISDRIEIHEHSMNDGMMRMRQVMAIKIKPDELVKLQPSGFHLMVFAVKQQLKQNTLIPFTFHFSNQTKIDIQLPVYQYK